MSISKELDKHIAALGIMLASDEGANLWAILCALRGPDNEDLTLKACTTCVIRHALLKQAGLGTQSLDIHGSSVSADNEEFRARRQKYDEMDAMDPAAPGAHFVQHSRSAFRALGLKWEELNP